MVISHAFRLVPSVNDERLPQALTKVSWTRSSALSALPHNETAKARRFEMAEIRSAFTPETSTVIEPCSMLRLGTSRLVH